MFWFWVSPKPAIIRCHISAGEQPSAPMGGIIFFIIPAIICDIILGIAWVARATTIPPAMAAHGKCALKLGRTELDKKHGS
jgi:hypothetical protein